MRRIPSSWRGNRARHAILALALLVLSLAASGQAFAMDIQRLHIPGGGEAWLVEDHANPIIALELEFRGGAALDPAGKEGLTRMVTGTLDEGAGPLDSKAFQGRLEDLSIALRFSATLDTISGSLTTLTEFRDEAFRLLGLALTQPRFDAEPVERIRSQILADLRQRAEEPEEIANQELFRRLFPNHPYGRPMVGTEAGIRAITVDDLRGVATKRLGRDNLIVGVVGDVTAAELQPLLAAVFGPLPAHATPWEVPEVVPAAAAVGLTVIEQDISQSAIVVAQQGVKRDDPDYYAAYVLNQILGGSGMTSRLYEEIREKRGLAYSVFTSLQPYAHAGLVTAGAGTARERTAETLDVLREQWRTIAAKGVTEAELADAKTYLTGSFPLLFSSSQGIADVLVAVQYHNLGFDYLDRRDEFVEAVTLDDVNRVARSLLDVDRLAIVVVGQAKAGKGAPSVEHDD